VKVLRKILILTFVILFYLPAKAQNVSDSIFSRTYLDFFIIESEVAAGSYLSGDVYELGFKEYDNKEIPNTRAQNDRMITLRSEIYIDSVFSNQKLYLVVMPANYPCNIYLNGELLFAQGNYMDGYTSRMHYTENVFLPPVMINFNEKNHIAFQLFPKEGETHPLNIPFIASAREATNFVFYRNLYGPKLILASSFCGFIFFIFFLFTYISRREYNKPQYLYFALMNLFLIFSWFNNIFTFDYTNTFAVELVSRLGFQFSMIVGLFFLFDYTNIFKNKKYFRLGVLVIYVPAIVMLSIQNNLTDLIRVNNLYPIYILLLGNISFVVITTLYFLKEKNTKSFILFFVYLLNFLAGMYDSYYFVVVKIKPSVLLTPNSVFIMNLTIFFVLLIDHSKIYHLATKSSKQLQELNENLEILVEERTQKTKEYAVKLEEANKTKDKFFSIIAHDLKNPFNTLIGYSDLLKSEFREYGPNEIHQHLSTIHETSVKGFNLLENLLKWSQAQTNKIEFVPEKINLYQIVQTCVNDIEHQSLFKDIEVHNDVPKDYNTLADENLLKTIFRNLINNAVKYTPRNGYVVISAEKKEDSIEISIKDSGIGMTDKELKNLFKIDQISSKPGTDKEKGSGLGLVLCKEFVEKHGGIIWVESDLESGSIFKFTIPKIIRMN
jgi:signal transduction histidine kinase